jgi:hypothetical protein
MDVKTQRLARETTDIVSKRVVKETWSLRTIRALQYLEQLATLLIDRWVGLEGVLAVVSHENLGARLFAKGMLEDPHNGSRSLYQRISRSPYRSYENFIFQTLPGVIAVLYYSGSLAVVFVGMASIAAVLTITEAVIHRFIGNPYFSAVTGLTTAYVICQLAYPYLSIIFILQLWLSIGILCIIQAMFRRYAN